MFKIKKIAEDKGWTQQRLLHVTRVDPSRLDQWWRNSEQSEELEASLEALLKVADLLQVAPRDLIADVPDEKKTQRKRPRMVR